MDIELMSTCDYFVGTLSSTLGRAAFEIMTARLGHAPPFVSLDRHGWFYAQGVGVSTRPHPSSPHPSFVTEAIQRIPP